VGEEEQLQPLLLLILGTMVVFQVFQVSHQLAVELAVVVKQMMAVQVVEVELVVLKLEVQEMYLR
tara:strand:+ start:56 stop:250 length:195 start_codon:yes stop_codon:yes gene_type:complete